MATADTSWLQVDESVAPAVVGLSSWLQVEDEAAAPPPPPPPGVTGITSWLQIDGVPIEGAPAAPTSVAADATGANTATVTWVDASSNETGFQVQLETPPGAANWFDATGSANPTAPGVQTFSATGLSGATDYRARVRALGATLNSDWTLSGEFGTDNVAGGGGVIPVASLTSVSRDQALTYSTLTSVSRDQSLTYPILNAVLRDRALSWGIEQPYVTADLTLAFNTNNVVLASLPLAYSIRSGVTRDRAMQWAVRSALTPKLTRLKVTLQVNTSIK